MNLKQLITFGIEESQEPVIKNPVMRAALQEPRTMAQEPRIGLKPGGIVEPGVTHYGKLTEAEKVANIAKWKKANPDLNFDDLGQSQTSKIRTTGNIRIGVENPGKGKEPRVYELIDEKSWKKITDRIKNLRLQENNKGLTNEAFTKKLNNVYKIKTRTGTTWDKSILAQLQQNLGISQEVATKVRRSLPDVKKIIGTLKTGEQILKDFEAGKISEFQLRKKATSKINIDKPETILRMKKWKKENPELVRAMEERKQLKTWYQERRAFPRIPKNAKSNIWANLHENVRKKRGRIELIDENVVYEKEGTIKWSREGKNGKPNWQNVKFKDKVKNAVFTWDNLEKKVDNVFGENAYKKFAFPYEARNQLTEATITYKGEERSVGSVLNESLLKKHYKTHARPGETFDAFKAQRARGFGAFEANHMYANDPWQTQLTFRDSNRELSNLDDTFQAELRKAVDDPKKIKLLTKNFITEVKALPGGIEWNIGDQMIGKKPSIGSVTQAAFGETGLIRTFEANQIKLFKQLGYRCRRAAGGEETVACYMSDVEKTRADMKSSHVEVRAKAFTKQRKALQLASKIPQLKKILKTGIQLGTAAITKPLQWLGLTSGIGYAIEGIVEGGFYDNARRKGYSHEQAMAETFTPGLIAGRPHDVPWYGGSEKLREKELYEIKGRNEFIDVENRPPMHDPEFEKVIGTRGKVKQYIDALGEQDRIYSAIGKKEAAKRQNELAKSGLGGGYGGIPLADLDAPSADVHDLARSGAYRRVDQTLRPESMASQAYNTAVENRDALDQRRRTEYLEKVEPRFLEREQKSFDTKRHQEKRYQEMDKMYPVTDFSDELIDKLLKQSNMYINPKFRSEGRTVKNPQGLEFLQGYTYDDVRKFYKAEEKRELDKQKQSYYADNFRMEKAEGGIMSLKKKR